MKRMSLTLAVVAGLAVATVVGLSSSHGASAGGPDGLKCYRVKLLEQKGRPNWLLYISDQFEEKNLIVKKPIEFCGLAGKDRTSGMVAGDPPLPENLVCYGIKDAPGQKRFVRQEVLTEDQFMWNDLLLTKPLSLCEPAEKGKVIGGGSGAGDASAAGFDNSLLDSYEFKCYNVRRVEHPGLFYNAPTITISDQFVPGGKEARLGRPTVFCTQVFDKKLKAKNNHIENIRTLTAGELEHVSTISANNDRSDPPSTCGSYGHSVWYTYTPSEDEVVSITTEGSTYETLVGVYTGSPGSLTEVACNSSGSDTTVETKLSDYTKYYILVGAEGTHQAGKLKLLLRAEACAQQCEAGASAAGPALPAPILNLVCYPISQPKPYVDIVTYDQLNANFLEVGRANLYCTPADKCTFADEESIGGVADKAGGVQICDS